MNFTRRALLAGAVTVASRAQDEALPFLPKPVQLAVIGTGRRGFSLLQQLLRFDKVQITALADLDSEAAAKAADAVLTSRRPKPFVVTGGPEEYKRVLDRKDVDAVLVASPEPTHASMSISALAAGKNVLSEVAAAVTIEECHALIEQAAKSKSIYMMAENVCYYRQNLAMLAMVQAGLFGDATWAECGYVHPIPSLSFDAKGNLTWRGELMRTQANWYPTHAIGPVAQWLGIGKTDRFKTVSAFASRDHNFRKYAAEKFKDSDAAKQHYTGDLILCVITTQQGRVIELRFDVASPRPIATTTYFGLQGTRGAYRDFDDKRALWLEGMKDTWADFEPYQAKYDHDLWKKYGRAASASGHGGADLLTLYAFLNAVATGSPSPISAREAVAWSSIIPLSLASVRKGGAPIEVPAWL